MKRFVLVAFMSVVSTAACGSQVSGGTGGASAASATTSSASGGVGSTCRTIAECDPGLHCTLDAGGCHLEPDNSGCACFCCDVGSYFTDTPCTTDAECGANHVCVVFKNPQQEGGMFCVGAGANTGGANGAMGVCAPSQCQSDSDCDEAACVLGICSTQLAVCSAN